MAINRLVCKAVRLRVIIILFLLFLDSNDICQGALCMVPVVDGGRRRASLAHVRGVVDGGGGGGPHSPMYVVWSGGRHPHRCCWWPHAGMTSLS